MGKPLFQGTFGVNLEVQPNADITPGDPVENRVRVVIPGVGMLTIQRLALAVEIDLVLVGQISAVENCEAFFALELRLDLDGEIASGRDLVALDY